MEAPKFLLMQEIQLHRVLFRSAAYQVRRRVVLELSASRTFAPVLQEGKAKPLVPQLRWG